MNPVAQNIVTLFVGAFTFMTLLVGWSSLRRKTVRSQRLRTVAYRDSLREAALERRSRGRRRSERLSLGARLHRTVGNLKVLSAGQQEKTKLLLMQAGWRQREALAVYIFVKLVAPICGAAGAFSMVWGLNLFEHLAILRIGALIAGGLLGSIGIDILLKGRIKKRQKKIGRALPDVMDLLVICAETGLGFDTAVNRVSQEFDRPCPEMAEELSVLEAELTFMPDRRTAFENLAKRTGLASIGSMVTTILQGERYGTPLAQSLRTLAAEFRAERLLKAEQKAARLPAIMTIPLIVFILPTLFIVVIGPAILNVIDTFKHMN